MEIVTFKSKLDNWEKEMDGRKCNTIRKIDKNDKRFSIHPTHIKMKKLESRDYFIRELTDITDYMGWRIFSWKHEQKQEREEIWKLNTMRLMKHHKLHCEGEKCNISLYLVMDMAKKAGVKFTREDIKVFL